MKLAIAAFCLVVLVLVAATIKGEIDNPCVEYGPERLMMMQRIGDTMFPVYTRDCLRRTKG